jgi:hypothetical protein
MVFPDIPEVESGCTLGRDGGVHRNEVRALSYAVNDVHNCIITMGFRQFHNEVNTDHIPWCFRSLRGVELTKGSSTLYFSLVTQVAVLNVDANVAGHLWPPIIAGYQLEGVRGHPSIPLLPLSLTMSIGIPHGLYTYPTTSIPLRPPRDNRCSSSISQCSTIRPT